MALLFPLLLLGVMYAFLILPQRKRAKAHAELLRAIAPGDEIVTSGGIYGGVTEIDGDDVYLEIAPDVEIKITRRAVAERISVTTPAPVQESLVDDVEPNGLVEDTSDSGDDTPEKGAKKK
jgi:preprotein translocase subunit YajC